MDRDAIALAVYPSLVVAAIDSMAHNERAQQADDSAITALAAEALDGAASLAFGAAVAFLAARERILAEEARAGRVRTEKSSVDPGARISMEAAQRVAAEDTMRNARFPNFGGVHGGGPIKKPDGEG